MSLKLKLNYQYSFYKCSFSRAFATSITSRVAARTPRNTIDDALRTLLSDPDAARRTLPTPVGGAVNVNLLRTSETNPVFYIHQFYSFLTTQINACNSYDPKRSSLLSLSDPSHFTWSRQVLRCATGLRRASLSSQCPWRLLLPAGIIYYSFIDSFLFSSPVSFLITFWYIIR